MPRRALDATPRGPEDIKTGKDKDQTAKYANHAKASPVGGTVTLRGRVPLLNDGSMKAENPEIHRRVREVARS
jgi:hypothetical protein